MGHFFQTAFTSVLLLYLVLFLLENIFPGFVSSNFDLNIMLVPLFITGIITAFFPTPRAEPKPAGHFDYLITAGLTALAFFIVLNKTQDLGSLRWVISGVSGLLVLFFSIIVLSPSSHDQPN